MTWRHNTSAAQRGYDSAWATVRRIVLTEEPRCRLCPAPSTDVDHIIPVSQRPDLRLVRSNLQGLCRRCHHAKTGREHGRRSASRPAEQHPGIIA